VEHKDHEFKTNRRNGTESGGFETGSLGDIRATVTTDRGNTLLSHQPRTAAPNQKATTAHPKSTGTTQPSSPLRSSGPWKMGKTDDELKSGPSFAAAAERTFGTSDKDLTAELFLQVTRALPNVEKLDPLGNHALAALYGIGPQDTLEGMLSAQMVAGHNLIMECFRRVAMHGQPPEGVERYVNLVTKLQRTYVAQMEALDRHRGKGEQPMNVEHVHIHDGAQAVVGSVSHQGPSNASEEDHGKSNG
jgi:hypothetical protein